MSDEFDESRFLSGDGFCIACHFVEPGVSIAWNDDADHACGLAGFRVGADEINEGALCVGEFDGLKEFRQVGLGGGGLAELAAPPVDIGEDAADVAGEHADGDCWGAFLGADVVTREDHGARGGGLPASGNFPILWRGGSCVLVSGGEGRFGSFFGNAIGRNFLATAAGKQE